MWIVYILLASDESLYTGITTDLSRRWNQHSQGKGAKYFRGRKPKAIVFEEHGHDHSSALKREIFIKRLTRCKKLALISQSCQDGNFIKNLMK